MCNYHAERPSKLCIECNITYRELVKHVDAIRKESIKLFELYKIHQQHYVAMHCKELDKHHARGKTDSSKIDHTDSALYYTNYVSLAFSMLMKKTEEFYSLTNRAYVYERYLIGDNYLSYFIWNDQDEYTSKQNVYATDQ